MHPPTTHDRERSALKISVVASLGSAILGCIFALLTHSEAILLDGIFALVGSAMTALALFVARVVHWPDDHLFHFGYAHFEPLFNVLKALLIAILCIFALLSAVHDLLQGGHALILDLALVYAVCASALCVGAALFLRRQARLCHSPLVEADAKGWLIDGLISATICLTFGVVWLLTQTAWARYAVYTDSALVIILIVLAIPIPLRLLYSNLREVLLMAPDRALQEDITRRFHAVIATYGLQRARLRILKSGRAILVLAHVLVEESFPIAGVQDLDAIRATIRKALHAHYASLTVDVLFTAEAQMLDA